MPTEPAPASAPAPCHRPLRGTACPPLRLGPEAPDKPLTNADIPHPPPKANGLQCGGLPSLPLCPASPLPLVPWDTGLSSHWPQPPAEAYQVGASRSCPVTSLQRCPRCFQEPLGRTEGLFPLSYPHKIPGAVCPGKSPGRPSLSLAEQGFRTSLLPHSSPPSGPPHYHGGGHAVPTGSRGHVTQASSPGWSSGCSPQEAWNLNTATINKAEAVTEGVIGMGTGPAHTRPSSHRLSWAPLLFPHLPAHGSFLFQ